MKALLVLTTLSLFAAFLLTRALAVPPTSYLHSWNQITTLALVRELTEDPSALITPHEVVTRITIDGARKDPADRDIRFRNFEEFPLYHLMAAGMTSIVGSPEMGSRIVTILCFSLLAIFLQRLYRRDVIRSELSREEYLCAYGLFLTSALFLYYGQAVMSDMGMIAFGVGSVYFLVRWKDTSEKTSFAYAVFCLALSSLFKSYGAVFLLSFFLLEFRRRSDHSAPRLSILQILAAVAALIPVLAWHFYAARYGGGSNEILSHSLLGKMSALVSSETLRTVPKRFTSTFGLVPFVVATIGIMLLCWRRWKNKGKVTFTFPLSSYALAFPALVFFVATIDKFAAHDYYFLPAAVALFPILAQLIVRAFELLPSRFLARSVGSVLLATHLVFVAQRVVKAETPNPDVMECAALVAAETSTKDLIAFASDVSRYNSIAYYAKRIGFTVQGTAFPLSAYREVGATYLILNFSEEDFQTFKPWLNASNASLILKAKERLSDYKDRPRLCRLYRIR